MKKAKINPSVADLSLHCSKLVRLQDVPNRHDKLQLALRRMDRDFGTQRLTGVLLYRLIHYVNILEMNGDSYRLGQSRLRKAQAAT